MTNLIIPLSFKLFATTLHFLCHIIGIFVEVFLSSKKRDKERERQEKKEKLREEQMKKEKTDRSKAAILAMKEERKG